MPPPIEWHYSRHGQRFGPCSAADLTQMAVDGRIGPDDLIWKEGMAEWKPARKVKGLFPTALAGGPPPLPVVVGRAKSPPVPADHEPQTGSGQTLDPVLAAVLSFVLTPLGQLLLGQRIKAAVFFLASPFVIGMIALTTFGVGLILLPVYNAFAALDAYVLAVRARAGRTVGPWEFGVPEADGLWKTDAEEGRLPSGLRSALIGMTAAYTIRSYLTMVVYPFIRSAWLGVSGRRCL